MNVLHLHYRYSNLNSDSCAAGHDQGRALLRTSFIADFPLVAWRRHDLPHVITLYISRLYRLELSFARPCWTWVRLTRHSEDLDLRRRLTVSKSFEEYSFTSASTVCWKYILSRDGEGHAFGRRNVLQSQLAGFSPDRQRRVMIPPVDACRTMRCISCKLRELPFPLRP